MAINLSPKETEIAKNFIKTLFYTSGVSPTYISTHYNRYWASWAAESISTEIVNRQFEFIKNKLDNSLNILATNKFKSPGGGWISRPAETLAKYIAWFCLETGIVWDDINFGLTTYELDAIKQTVLGGTLYNAGCFTSAKAAAQNAPAQPAQSANTGTTRTSAPRQPGQAPANGYKSTGGHSGDIPNLMGTAGQKENPNVQYMFCVEADKLGKNTPCAFITPIKATATGIAQVSKSQAEKISFGSGNGYTDCCLWFDNQQDANDLLQYCQNTFTKFSNYHISKAPTDKNGYFKVSTSLGWAYIKAKKLNEELDQILEELEEQTPVYENASKGFKITDIDLYDEWSRKSIS